MSRSKAESIHFYKYLCQKIGSEEVVKARRLKFISEDLSYSNSLVRQISSGSKAEGLNLKGSDLDMMFLIPLYVVYESDKDAVRGWLRVALVMDTEDTQPCFTNLRLYTNYNYLPKDIQQLLQLHKGEYLLSNELYKTQMLNTFNLRMRFYEVHGPCCSDKEQKLDLAVCLKCDQWVSLAQPWISRPRLKWPSPELISKITLCGVLFVPIGYKGSLNEHLQWRISFSVAEKILIYSFSHTQLLCYALLKILLKEIVDTNEDVKGLLCSYFLKTLMFWILEETETSVWRPDNIIPCFMACLQRLLYSIEYSTLLHYFIPDNNLFYLRFTSKSRNTLINTIKKSYQKGIQIFSTSQTLHDYRRFPLVITKSVSEISTLMKTIMVPNTYLLHYPIINFLYILNTLLHHCKTELSKCILIQLIAYAIQKIPLTRTNINTLNNKQQYKIYKKTRSLLLFGLNSDAVSGWLKLASFYVHKNPLTSIDIINYTLSKCTDESSLPNITLKQTQKLKLSSLLKTISCRVTILLSSIPIVQNVIVTSSLSFAYFLRFLCCYHLQDLKSCEYCINHLSRTLDKRYLSEKKVYMHDSMSLAIACQMLGQRNRARKYFHLAAQNDQYNISSKIVQGLQNYVNYILK